MEFNTEGCSVFVVGLLVLVAVAVIVLFVAPNLDKIAADKDRAAAERIRAETAYEAQKSENWQHEFMLWSAFLELNDDDVLLVVLLFAAIAAIAVLVGYLIGTRR